MVCNIVKENGNVKSSWRANDLFIFLKGTNIVSVVITW